MHWCTANHISSPSKVLDAGMESYIVQLDISAAFCWMSHSGLLLKLKTIDVEGSVLSIFREFLSNGKQRVVVLVLPMIEWIPIVSSVTHWSVLGPLLFIQYFSEMFELVDNRLYAYAAVSMLQYTTTLLYALTTHSTIYLCICINADVHYSHYHYTSSNSTLLAVVPKPADRPAVAAYLIRTWQGVRSGAITGECFWILTNLSRYSLVYPPNLTWSCLGVPFAPVPTSTSFSWSWKTASSHLMIMCVVLFVVSLRELICWD